MHRRPGALIRALLVVGAILAATSGLTATRAAFTDEQSFDWTLQTGTVALTSEGDGLVFSSAALAPGDAATGTVTVTNDGTEPLELSLARELLSSTSPGGCAVRDALRLKIAQGATTLVDAPLATAAASLELDDLAPAASREYTFTLTFVPQHGAGDTDNDNCFQGSVDQERFTWNAVEAS